MVGMLVWNISGREKTKKAVILRERNILHVRMICAEIRKEAHTLDVMMRRRIRRAVRQLQKFGVQQVILPPNFLWRELLSELGIQPVSTLPLRQMLAADWVRWELKGRDIPAAEARIAVLAENMTGAVVRTVTELSLRHRYVLLKVSYGGEALCSHLRREYGVSVLLNPDRGSLERSDVVVVFDQRTDIDTPGRILLYDESAVIPSLLLPPVLEDMMPLDTERAQMLTVLLEAGVLRPGQIAFQGRDS